MGDDQITETNVRKMLENVSSKDPTRRDQTAAQLSKVAAKAEDDILLLLSDYASHFVAWLKDPELEPLVRAYTACILANIAFLEPGQQKVLDAGGVHPLVEMLKRKDDKKVTLHSTAAVQNLTYKNTQCCQEVLEEGGERALKKLLQVRHFLMPQGRLSNATVVASQPPFPCSPSPLLHTVVTQSSHPLAGRSTSRKTCSSLRRVPSPTCNSTAERHPTRAGKDCSH